VADFYQYESIFESEIKEESRCVIRLQTNIWSDKRGLHYKKSLSILKRKCKGFNILEEDTSNIGAEDLFPKILNFNECKDGIYEVVTCNESRDYETGYIDDYDYRLIPYNSK
jgi:hypothetical protein